MEICKIHYKLSKPVSRHKEIKADAVKLLRFVERGAFQGFYNKAFAVAHAQVSETPYAFFVVAQECVNEKMFPHRIIINPEIIEAPLHKKIDQLTIPNTTEYQEPCLSFPFRKPKRIIRFDYIKVKYQVPRRLWGFKTIKTDLTGIASEIFQHECEHIQGKNIYFESETPVKWWELLGSKRPVGGVSLDQFDPSGMTPAKEKPKE
jgi:peptide deformylase